MKYALLGLGVALGFLVLSIYVAERRARPKRPPVSDAYHQQTRRVAMMALACIVAGTLVWRIRSADELAANPLDAAGMVRVAFDLLGLALSMMTWHRLGASGRASPGRGGGRISPTVLYVLYVFVVTIGMATAVRPLLVGFRAFELAVVPLAVAAVARAYTFEEVLHIARKVLYAFTALIVLSVVLFGSLSLTPTAGGLLPFRLEPALPAISANSVGTFGAMLVALSVPGRKIQRWPLLVGVALVILAQYRTGMLAVAAMFVTYMVVRWRAIGVTILLALIGPAYWLLTSPAVAQIWLRGDTAGTVSTLTGRTAFWARALDVAERSPVIGTGLTSGTRYEVLPYFGFGETSTIHSTWIETYLGTGIMGLLLIAALFLQFAWSSWKLRAISMAPLLFAALIAVRSITGTTIELAGPTQILFALLAIATWRRANLPPAHDASGVDGVAVEVLPAGAVTHDRADAAR